MKKTYNEFPSNPSTGACFAEIANKLSRRSFVRAGLGVAAVGFLGGARSLLAIDSSSGEALPFSFLPVPISHDDVVTVPYGYQAQHLFPWGHPINGSAPEFKLD